mmetsp:Transcript_12439/g.25832  ORF Transcript_12439/g.25832 Transcript_12439/m.25832 type:complete len:102 (-) Transcript_12439:1444-1749(-)
MFGGKAENQVRQFTTHKLCTKKACPLSQGNSQNKTLGHDDQCPRTCSVSLPSGPTTTSKGSGAKNSLSVLSSTPDGNGILNECACRHILSHLVPTKAEWPP